MLADLVGADKFASDWKKSVQKNTVDAIFKGAEDYVDKASVLDGRSDAISQGLGQVAAILLTGGAAGAAGLGTAGATALTTAVTGLSGMGSGMSQAYQEGATDGEAVAYGAISGTAEALTELIFAGMGKSVKALGFSKGLYSADDILAKKLSSKISSQLGKNLVELGVKAGAEGTEEVLSGVAQAFGKKLTYMSEEDLGKIIKDERLFDQFLTGAITSGIAQSGIVPGMKAGSFMEATKAGRDLITVDEADTGKTTQKNATQEGGVKYSLMAFEKDGRRFVEVDQNQDRFDGHSPDEYPGIAKEIIKEKFENRVIGIDNKMFVNGAGRSEFAYPSKPITDADIYEAKMRSSAELDNLLDAGANYRNEADGKDGHVHRDAVGGFDYYDTLFKIGNRYFEGRINIKNVKRGKLFTDVTQIKDVTQAIMSSYGQNPKSQFLRTSSIDSISNANENVNSQVPSDADYQERYKPYQVDLSQYKPQEQAIYKRHMDSGMVNNRKATHEFVDLLVKLETEKGVHFDLSTSERLAQSGFAVEGATVSGVKTADGILVNINANSALNSVVGHEIMHVFEGTEYYDVIKQAVKEFAEAKGIYQSRYDSIAKLYEKVQGADIEGELTAELIGEYLFTNKEFVRNLSTNHRNLFQRIYDEIKYLCRLATANSDEARKLEKVKKTFADMYRDVDVKNTAQTDGVKYKISDLDIDRVYIDFKDTQKANEAVDAKVSDLVERGKVVPLSEESISKYKESTDWSIYKEVRQLLRDVLKPNMGISVVFEHGDQGAVAYLTSKGINHSVGGLASPKKAAAFELFRSLVKNAEYVYSSNNDEHNNTNKNIDGDILWDTFVAVGTVNGEQYPVTFKIRSIDADVRSQIYEMATKNETGFSHEDGDQKDLTHAHSNYGTSPVSNERVTQDGKKVNGKFSLSEKKETAPAGGYRITGEDIALAPTKEDIARMEQEAATAQDAPRNDLEELGAPTREDIAKQERDKKLKGPLLMKDSLDRELEKLYRLQQLNQIQDNAYFVELFKVNEAYQAAGRDFSEALSRVVGAYQGDMETQATAVNEDTQRNERRLTDEDLADYMRVGIRKHVRDEKQKIVDAGDSPILTKPSDIVAFIRNALYGKEKDVVKAYGRANSKLAKAVSEATKGTVNIDDYYLELDANRIAHIKDHVGEDKDNRNIPLTEKQIEEIPTYVDNFDDLINVICRKDGSVRLMLGKKINGHSIIVETVSRGRKALHPVTAYQVSTSDYISKYKTRAIDRSSTSRSANADTVDISRPATAPADTSIPKIVSDVKQEEVEAVIGEKDAYISKQANALYDEVKSMQKGKRVSNTLSYLLDTLDLSEEHKAESYNSLRTALLNIRDNPNQVVNPNSAVEAAAREMLGREYDAMAEDFANAEGVAKSIYTKMESLRTELENNQSLREQSNTDFDSEIARLQAEYEGKKNKNTKAANDILRRIERVQRLKSQVDADYGKRIDRLGERLEKISKPEYRTAMQRKAFNRVVGAYQGKVASNTVFTNEKRILHPKYSEADISENKRKLANMETVHQIDAVKMEKTGKKPSAIFAEYFESLGNNISSERFGDVALSNSSVKSEVRHGITAEKIASIEAIPSVIESGEVIFEGKKNGTDVERIVVAAPIKIGDKSYYMGVMLQRDSQNQRLYLHNVQIEEEALNAPQADLLTTGADGANESLFITSILQDAIRVKYLEEELHGPWRMTDPLDQKVEKLYRMMLREQVSEEDYIAQLVKADKQYQQRGSKVEEALERVREAYSKETTETPETEKKMERLTRKVLHKGIMDRIRDALAKAGFYLQIKTLKIACVTVAVIMNVFVF